MKASRSPDELWLVRKKLDELQELIELCEHCRSRLEGTVLVEMGRQECGHAIDVPRLVQTMRKSLEVDVKKSVTNSLVTDDLRIVQQSFGSKFQDLLRLQQLNLELSETWIRQVAIEPHGNTTSLTAASAYKAAVTAIIESGLAVALPLREHYLNRLKSIGGLSRNEARKMRTARIRQLHRENPKVNQQQLTTIALEDPQLKELGEPVTYEVVRNAVTRRRQKRKTK